MWLHCGALASYDPSFSATKSARKVIQGVEHFVSFNKECTVLFLAYLWGAFCSVWKDFPRTFLPAPLWNHSQQPPIRWWNCLWGEFNTPLSVNKPETAERNRTRRQRCISCCNNTTNLFDSFVETWRRHPISVQLWGYLRMAINKTEYK